MPWVEALSDPQELRQCIRDLVALSSRPALSADYDPGQIAEAVALALLPIIRADFIYAVVPSGVGGPLVEVLHLGETFASPAREPLRVAIRHGIAERMFERPWTIDDPSATGSLRLAYAPIGAGGEAAAVAGSRHAAFPHPCQQLLLEAAAKEVTLASQRWQANADKHRFVSLIERSSDFIGVASLDGRTWFINPAGYSLVGLSPRADISQLHILDFIDPVDQALVRDYCWPGVLRTGRWRGEIQFRHFETGEAIPFMVDAFRINYPQNGKAMNIATVSRDLRAQKQNEAELRGLNEMLEHRVLERTSQLANAHAQLVEQVRRSDLADLRLRELQVELSHAGRLGTAGQMAAAIAHELNQPLTAAVGAANTARRLLTQSTSDSIGTAQRIMDEIAGHLMRAGQILRQLRDFVGRGRIEKRVENVSTLIEDAVSFTLAGSAALGVAVHVSLDPAAATVYGNRIQVQQVIVNLMRNAFEAMVTSPRRELYLSSARVDPQTIEIAVADTGPGLTAEVANRLFEPFLSTKGDGMGLGLSLCRSLVQAHGGQLRYEANPSGGAIFRFTLSSGEDHAG